MKIIVQKGYEIPKEGFYIANFTGYKIKGTKKTKNGDLVKDGFLNFILDDGSKVSQYVYFVGWNKSLVKKLIKAIKGNVGDCDLDSIIGSEVGVEIKHTMTVSDIYANVINIVAKEEGIRKVKEQSINPEENEEEPCKLEKKRYKKKSYEEILSSSSNHYEAVEYIDFGD